MTLKARSSLGMAAIHERWAGAATAAETSWGTFKFRKYETPDISYPDLPAMLTDVSNEELVRLLVVIRSWSNYVGEQMVHWKMRRDAAKEELKAVRGRLLEEMQSSIKSADERWKTMDAHEDVINTSAAALKIDYIFESFAFRYSQLSKMHNTVSRALSVREAELESLHSQYGDGPGYRQKDPHEMDDD